MKIDTGQGRLLLTDGDVTVAEYVYEPSEPQLESPRPYLLLRTRDGADVTAYRPADHVWHKGLSLALPAVGPHNFWGGPSYIHGRGYVQLPNNGAQVHRSFELAHDDGPAGFGERLDWVAQDGALVLTEERRLTARPVDGVTWALTWRSALTNVSGRELGFGSPTSKGRENAGYCGIFWRGPVEFTGGEILAPSGPAGDAARGEPGPWLAFVAPDGSAGVLMLDAGTGNGDGEPPVVRPQRGVRGPQPRPVLLHRDAAAAGRDAGAVRGAPRRQRRRRRPCGRRRGGPRRRAPGGSALTGRHAVVGAE